jgi:hypothetical protein
MTAEQRSERARLAAKTRWNRVHGSEETRIEKAADRIAELIATAPELTDEQVARIRALLNQEATA